jgi:HEAT repeat protein
MFAGTSAFADGCFVFRWNKQKDINEPTQKAIIFHDENREDLILQVKYEGPAEDFGWLIPVPGQPEVRQGSMRPFYELSRLTQEHFGEGVMHRGMAEAQGGKEHQDVKVIEVKTVGAYEVAVLSSTNPSALADWLAAHHFSFPKEKQSVLEQYIQKHWFFVAARINPEGNGFVVKSGIAQPATISAATRKKLASGELHPIIISFPSEKCLFPLAISSVNGAPSEISLYVLSAEPLASPVIFDRKLKVYKSAKDKSLQARGGMKKSLEEMRARTFQNSPLAARMNAEDPNDPPPINAFDLPGLGARGPELYQDSEEDFYSRDLQLVRSMSVEGDAAGLKACRHDLRRMKGKQWWLTKLVETFPPEDMVDLEFEPAIPFLAEKLRREDGEAAAHCLPQYGSLATPTVLAALNDSDADARRRALPAAAEMSDSRFVDPLLNLLEDPDPKTRARACYATARNWSRKFEKPLLRLLYDWERGVAQAAQYCLREHLRDIDLDATTLSAILAKDGPASLLALQVLQTRGEVSEEDLKRLLSSTNLPVVSSAFTPLRSKLQLEDLDPLMTNSLPMARLMALGVLARMADKPAVGRIISMLHDPNEAIRWRVRSALRRLTGQKLGADPAAYEKWWAENKETYVPVIAQSRSRTP